MPLNENLNVKFTAVDQTAINTALDSVTAVITATVPDPLNLSDEERSGTRTISNIRLPYAHRAVNEFGILYPNLNGIDVSQAKASNNFDFFQQLSSVEVRLLELLDRIVDIKINTGFLTMKFTDDQYVNAERYKNRNVPGADTVYDEQNPLYDRDPINVPAGGGGGG